MELKTKQELKQKKKDKVIEKCIHFLNKCIRITNSRNIPNIEDLDLSINTNTSDHTTTTNSSINDNLMSPMDYNDTNTTRKSLLLLRKKGGKLKSLKLHPSYTIQHNNINNDIDYSEIWQSSTM